MAYHYGVPPQHYNKFYDSGYETSSPQSSGEYVHYIPQQYDYSTPVKGHRRKASHTPTSARVGGWFSPAGSPPHDEDRYAYADPRQETYVSYNRKRASSSATKPQPQSTRKSNVHVRVNDSTGYRARDYDTEERRPRSSRHAKKPSTDSYFYFGQEQVYEESKPKTRTRRSSTTTKQSPRKERSPPKPRAVATPEDAARAGIPAGYSIRNWDPAEEPLILLGSVFDADSLGRWIYDWTVFKCGISAPMADLAGEVWLLLIKLAGKMKRSKECVLRVRDEEQRNMIYEFIDGGQRLWKNLKQLLKDCEYFMLKAAKAQGSKTMMGKNAGTEFVASFFGKDRYLEDTERFMHKLQLWNMRFDVNCEEILRRPPPRAN